MQDKFQEVLTAYNQHNSDIKELERQIKKRKEQQIEVEKSFLTELLAPYYNFNDFPYLPLDNNLFFSDITLNYNTKTSRMELYGLRFSFNNGQKVFGNHGYISLDEWLNIPEEVKKVDFQMLSNKNNLFADAYFAQLSVYHKYLIIAKNSEYTLLWGKVHLPHETFKYYDTKLVLMATEPEHNSKITDLVNNNDFGLSKFEFIATPESNRHYVGITTNSSRLNPSLVKEVSSTIVNLFGEAELKIVYSKLLNKTKTKKVVKREKAPVKVFESIDLDNIKL